MKPIAVLVVLALGACTPATIVTTLEGVRIACESGRPVAVVAADAAVTDAQLRELLRRLGDVVCGSDEEPDG